MYPSKTMTTAGLLRGLCAAALLTSAATAQGAPQLADLLEGLPTGPAVQDNLAHPSNRDKAPQISPAQAAERARKQHGGKVLSVDLVRGGAQYRVKIIHNGNVRVVRVPAN